MSRSYLAVAVGKRQKYNSNLYQRKKQADRIHCQSGVSPLISPNCKAGRNAGVYKEQYCQKRYSVTRGNCPGNRSSGEQIESCDIQDNCEKDGHNFPSFGLWSSSTVFPNSQCFDLLLEKTSPLRPDVFPCLEGAAGFSTRLRFLSDFSSDSCSIQGSGLLFNFASDSECAIFGLSSGTCVDGASGTGWGAGNDSKDGCVSGTERDFWRASLSAAVFGSYCFQLPSFPMRSNSHIISSSPRVF